MFFDIKSRLLTSSIAFALLASACSENISPQEYIVSAKEELKQGNTDEAVIYLKNLLKLNPENGQGRYLLGSAYAEQGDWSNAEKELNRANTYGFDKVQIFTLLAKVYFNLGDVLGIEDLLSQVEANTTEHTNIKTYLAMSLTEDLDSVRATELFESIVATKSDSPYVLLSSAYLKGIVNNNTIALQLVDELLSQYPYFAEALSFKAKILFNDKQMKESVSAFSRYLNKYKQDHKMRMRYALALVSNEQYKEAEQQAAFLLKVNKSNPLMNQVMAQTKFAEKNYFEAKKFAETAIESGIYLPFSRIIAGISSYQLKQYEIAYNHLISIKDALPSQHLALNLLNALRFQLGYEHESFTELNETPIDELDLTLLSATAKELFRKGKTKEAFILMSKANKLDPENAELIFQQGIIGLFNDNVDVISLFKKALEKNPKLDSAAVMLVIKLVKDKKPKEAMKIAEKLKETNQELGYSLIAGIYNNQGDIVNATKYFEQVLLLNEHNIGAIFNLAKIAQSANQLSKSLELFQKILVLDSEHIPALIELLKLAKIPQLQVEVESILKENVLSNKQAVTAHLSLSEYYLINKEALKAQKTIEQGLLAIPDSKQLLIVKTKIALQLKQYDLAMSSVNKALEIDGVDAIAHSLKSQSFLLKGDLLAAIKEQEIAVNNLKTDKKLFKLQLANLYVQNNNVSLAKNIEQELNQKYKTDISMSILTGNIAFLEKDYKKAINVFEKVNNIRPSAPVVLKLATSLQNTGKPGQALNVINDYENQLTNEILSVEGRLKQAELNSEELPEKAIAIYKGLLETASSPKHIILNNLAWLYLKQADKNNALSSAKQAIKIAANEPAIQNTYGVMLLEEGNTSEALAFLKKAYEANRAKQSYKLHYAQALIANNEQQKAKKLVEGINSAYLKGDELNRFKAIINKI